MLPRCCSTGIDVEVDGASTGSIKGSDKDRVGFSFSRSRLLWTRGFRLPLVRTDEKLCILPLIPELRTSEEELRNLESTERLYSVAMEGVLRREWLGDATGC